MKTQIAPRSTYNNINIYGICDVFEDIYGMTLEEAREKPLVEEDGETMPWDYSSEARSLLHGWLYRNDCVFYSCESRNYSEIDATNEAILYNCTGVLIEGLS